MIKFPKCPKCGTYPHVFRCAETKRWSVWACDYSETSKTLVEAIGSYVRWRKEEKRKMERSGKK